MSVFAFLRLFCTVIGLETAANCFLEHAASERLGLYTIHNFDVKHVLVNGEVILFCIVLCIVFKMGIYNTLLFNSAVLCIYISNV